MNVSKTKASITLAPIVLFVYNRSWHTQETVETLKKNELASESELFIYSDAPKTKQNKAQVKEVRDYIHSIVGFKKVTIIERDKNWGLADSIIDGVTTIVNQYGKIIVMEDDLVTSPFFLKYMNDALSYYQNIDTVFHISAYVYPIHDEGLEDTFFVKPTTCWGWATWEESWGYYKKDSDLYLQNFSKKMVKDFNLNGAYKYFDQIKLNQTNDLNTWAIFWYASAYVNNGLSLHPKRSFVKNIGHDGEGVNCVESLEFDVELVDKYNITFTNNIFENVKARVAFQEFFNGLKISFFKRVLNKLKKLIS